MQWPRHPDPALLLPRFRADNWASPAAAAFVHEAGGTGASMNPHGRTVPAAAVHGAWRQQATFCTASGANTGGGRVRHLSGAVRRALDGR